MGLLLIVSAIFVFNVPSSYSHFLNDVDCSLSDSEFFETDVSSEKLLLSRKSRLEIDPESTKPKHVFESFGRQRRSVTSPYPTANNNNAAMFLPQQYAAYNQPFASAWSHNRMNTNQYPSEFPYPSGPWISARPNVATYANPHAPVVSASSLDPKESAIFLQTAREGDEMKMSKKEFDDFALKKLQSLAEHQNHGVSKTAHIPSELDPRIEHLLGLESNYYLRNNPMATSGNIPTEQRSKIMSEEEFFGRIAQDPSGASHSFKQPQPGFEHGIQFVSGSSFYPEEDQRSIHHPHQPHQEYVEKSSVLGQMYPESIPNVEVIQSKLEHDAVLQEKEISHLHNIEILKLAKEEEEEEEEEMNMHRKEFDNSPIKKLQSLAEKLGEEKHHTDHPLLQNDLGVATSLLHEAQKELVSGEHDAISHHHPIENNKFEKEDDEKHYQLYQSSYPYQHHSYGPNSESNHNHGNVASEYSSKHYPTTPEHRITAHKEEVALPSPTKVSEEYGQLYVSSHNPYEHQAYRPSSESLHNHGNVQSDYYANYYQAIPERTVTVYKEEEVLPSLVEVPEQYDLYWGRTDNHKVSFDDPCSASEESKYFISTPQYFSETSESDKKYLRKKLLRKMMKTAKKAKGCGRTVGRQMKEKEEEEDLEHGEGSKKRKPEKLRGFVRLLDTITRIVPDDIVDRIMNRSWDRLYRGHKNCWKCDEV